MYKGINNLNEATLLSIIMSTIRIINLKNPITSISRRGNLTVRENPKTIQAISPALVASLKLKIRPCC